MRGTSRLVLDTTLFVMFYLKEILLRSKLLRHIICIFIYATSILKFHSLNLIDVYSFVTILRSFEEAFLKEAF